MSHLFIGEGNLRGEKMRKILIFGASGDIGKYFVDYLKSHLNLDEFEILASGTRETNYFEKIGVTYFRVDISDKKAFSILPQEIYAVVDLAGFMPARMKGYNPQKYIDVNITGTLNVLEYCKLAHADRILYSQSFGDIKDWGEDKVVLTSDMPSNFKYDTDHTIYVMCKNFGVDLLKNYHAMYGLKAYVFRLPTIYLWSPVDYYYVNGEKKPIGYRLLIDKAQKGEPIDVWGDPSRVKDMVYVKDFCQMMYKALFVRDISFGHFNVGTGKGTSLDDQIKGIVSVFGNRGHYSPITYRPDMPNAPQYIMDITPAVRYLNYKPEYDYLSMLRDFKKEMEEKRFL